MLYFTVHDTMVHSDPQSSTAVHDPLQSTSVYGPLLSTMQYGPRSPLVDLDQIVHFSL